jgi:hypothetical protein
LPVRFFVGRASALEERSGSHGLAFS